LKRTSVYKAPCKYTIYTACLSLIKFFPQFSFSNPNHKFSAAIQLARGTRNYSTRPASYSDCVTAQATMRLRMNTEISIITEFTNPNSKTPNHTNHCPSRSYVTEERAVWPQRSRRPDVAVTSPLRTSRLAKHSIISTAAGMLLH
jgi:hypothetical protein